MSHRKGFTLIELLIVIAILGILAAAVIVVLNPAQLLAQARDGTRFSDLDSIKSAIALYLTDYSAPVLGTEKRATFNTACGFSAACVVPLATAIRATDGSGWVGVILNNVTGGSPIPTLPMDPTNNANYQYAYAGDDTNKTFELNARLESQKHRDRMKTDGGEDGDSTTTECVTSWTDPGCWYEAGTDPGLDL